MSDSPEELAKQKAIVTASIGRVTYFIKSGKDLTSDFSTYLFKFENDGSATVYNKGIGVLYFGMWNLVKAMHNLAYTSGSHAVESMNNKKLITLPGNYHMNEISGNWNITTQNDYQI